MSERLVSDEQWSFWMQDMKKPEGCTYDMMWAMADALTALENKKAAVKQIAFYENMWRDYKKRYDDILPFKDVDEDYTKKYNDYVEILKLVKGLILDYRKDLQE